MKNQKKNSVKVNQHLFTKKEELLPTRDGYGKALLELGKKQKNVMVLCCDLTDSTRSSWFKESYPDRFLEMGVAEQNMAGVAAGLAMEGKIPFISSYAVFSPGRNWDQVRISICYSNVSVKIAGCHAGISVGPDGATHQALEDIAITRVLPNMTVLVPCDANEAYRATLLAAKIKGPVYVRLTREKTPIITSEKTPLEVGKGYVLKNGEDVTLIACGPLVYEALKAAKEIEKEHDVSVQVINMPSIKPIDRSLIKKAAEETGAIVTVEEHQMNAGLGGAVAEVLAEECPTPMERVGMPDSFGESGEPSELLEKYEMTSYGIITAIRKVLKRKSH
ncbi:MAG: transketolase family protein [Candidatus Jacksonbacteria bacterium]|nr:transketolase family protein [Candidatus Jacksonbacteria bacterium]